MKSVNKLRIVNSFGCLLFVFYSFMLEPLSKPIIITKNFNGLKFTSGSYKVIIQKVEIWEKEKKLIIALDLDTQLF